MNQTGSSNKYINRLLTLMVVCLPFALSAQVEAGFGFDSNGMALCAPVNIEFQDQSDGDVAFRNWEINSISFSNETNPSYNFDTSGIFEVCLSVTNIWGDSDQMCDTLTVNSIETPSFSADRTYGCDVPFQVSFLPDSSILVNSNYAYFWDFGDGSSSTASAPFHQYITEGSFDVSLTMTDVNTGCSNIRVKESYINVGAPNAEFDIEIIDNGDCTTTEVQFNWSGIDTNIDFLWNFGDGTTSSEINPRYTYTQFGCFQPTLTLSIGNCSNSYTLEDCINVNGSTNLSYTTLGDLMTCDPAGTEVQFFALAPTGSTYLWNFGNLGTSTEQNPLFFFDEIGEFPVSMTVFFEDGCSISVVEETVVVDSIRLEIQTNTNGGCANTAIQFEQIIQLPYQIVSYNWDFGFTSSTLAQPEITFPDTGSYDVSLEVVAENGCTSSIELVDFIEIGDVVTADFTISAVSACADEPIFFEIINHSEFDDVLWDFGDGTTSSEVNPFHYFEQSGLNTISLTISLDGCSQTIIKEDVIEIIPPIARFEAETNCDNLTVTFSNQSEGAVIYSWDFGDGTTSSQENPTHVFPNAGDFEISLSVESSGEVCSDVVSMIVTVGAPVAAFSFENDTIICAGDALEVMNTSQNGVTFEWIYDDFNVVLNPDSTQNETPQFEFPYAGTFTGFGLIVTNMEGCTDSFMLSDTVFVNEIELDFEYETQGLCYPIQVDFFENSTSLGNVISYFWEFGDGNTSTKANPFHNYTISGGYEVRLTVKDALGCEQTTTQLIEIIAEEIDATFEVTQNDCNFLELHIEHEEIEADGYTFFWDFGDGTTSNSNQVEHMYEEGGIYTVCLTINSPSCESTYCEDLDVQIPEANFEVDNAFSPCPNEPLLSNFVDLSVGAKQWEWYFGDETDDQPSSTEPYPSHIYTATGNYTVCLIITNQFGCRDTLCKENYIEVAGPSASMSLVTQEGCDQIEIGLDIQTQNTNQYILDFGDGNILEGTGNINETIQHIYTETGSFIPTLQLTDSNGCSLTDSLTTNIHINTLGFDFESTNPIFCASEIQAISFFSVMDDLNDIISINWTFLGAETPTSTQINPTNIEYLSAGSYDVEVLVETSDCTFSILKKDYVIIDIVPEPIFETPNSNICTRTMLHFENTLADLSNELDFTWSINQTPIFFGIDLDYIFENGGTYELSLKATNENGCSTIYSKTIELSEGISIELLNDTLICQQEEVLLSPVLEAPNEVFYKWSPATDLSCEFCIETTASPLENTMYHLEAISSDGCVAEDSIHILVREVPPPNIQLTDELTICLGESIDIEALSNDNTATFNWNMEDEGLSCYENCNNPTANPNETTTYFVELTNSDGCSNQDSVRVIVLENEESILGQNISLCEGESVELTILNGINPVWENNSNLSCMDCASPIASPSQTEVFYVEAQATNGCTLYDSILVEVIPNLDIDAGENQAICVGDSVLLTADYDGEIIWTNQGDLIALNEIEVMVAPSENTTFSLTVLNGTCANTDQIMIEVFESVELFTSDYIICEGESVELEVEGVANNFEWLPTPFLDALNTENPTASPSETTLFTVIGSAGTCPKDTATILIEVKPNPIINHPTLVPLTLGSAYQFDPDIIGEGNYQYTWLPDDGLSCDDCPNPTLIPSSNINYELIVENEFECSDSINIQVNVDTQCSEDAIVTPSAFTPNNDGENDIFYIRGSATLELLKIFNRWGEPVFESTDKHLGWNGTFKGKLLNRDVYVYYVEAICAIDGSKIIKTGDITLLR